MVCKEVLPLMHKHFDEDITAAESAELSIHLRTCEACRRYFQQLERMEALVRMLPKTSSSGLSTERIMNSLPPARKRISLYRWIKRHPAASVAAVFICLMLGSFLVLWDENSQLVVKGADLEHIVIRGDTVYVPAGKTVNGDLIVQSGKVQVEGDVKGDVVVIDGSIYMASTAHISGHVTSINQGFEWIWFKVQEWFRLISK